MARGNLYSRCHDSLRELFQEDSKSCKERRGCLLTKAVIYEKLF